MNPIVLLSPTERDLVIRIGRLRCDAKPAGVRETDSGFHKGTSDRAYPHMVGAAAEYAYAALTGREVDDRLFIVGDDHDFGGIEIKATTHSEPPFILPVRQSEYERKRPVAYVLAKVDPEFLQVEFLGSISWARFDRIKVVQFGKHKRNWAVRSEHLAPGLAVVEGGQLKLIQFERDVAVA